MPSMDMLRLRKAIQYTGPNGTEVATFANIPIISDNGVQLILGDPGSGWVAATFNVGDWYESTEGLHWTNTDFSARHITKDAALLDTNTVFDPTAINAAVAANTTALAGKLAKTDIASISVPILLLNATADRPITWARPFNNTSYDLSYAFDVNTLGRITCAPVAGTKTVNGVTIRISASLLAVTVLGVVHVLGVGA